MSETNPYITFNPEPGKSPTIDDIMLEADMTIMSPICTAWEVLTSEHIDWDSPQTDQALETIHVSVQRWSRICNELKETRCRRV